MAELEGLRQQLQCAARRQAELQEENSVLWSQKEALAVEAGEREAGKEAELQPGARAEPGWLGLEALRSKGTRLLALGAACGLRAAAVAGCAVGKAADSEAGSPGQGVAHLCAVISLSVLEAVVQRGVFVWDQRIAVWSTQILVPIGNRKDGGGLPTENLIGVRGRSQSGLNMPEGRGRHEGGEGPFRGREQVRFLLRPWNL